MDDSELVRRWRDGDREAGGELIERHTGALARFVRGKLDADLEDLVQTTFLNLLDPNCRYDPTRPLKPYLLSVARHRLYDELRRRHRADGFDPLRSSLADLAPTPSEIIARTQQGRLLRLALRRISVEHQIVLELFYWENMASADIATVIGVPDNTVRSRLVRAKEAIAKQIRRMADSKALADSTLRELQDHSEGRNAPGDE